MIPLRLIIDVVFCGLAILSFYMWAWMNEKYRAVKDERDALKSNNERLMKSFSLKGDKSDGQTN